MADDDKKTDPIDLDTLSDEDFLKLEAPESEEENDDADATSNADKTAADLAAEAAGSGDGSESTEADDGKGGQEGDGTEGEGGSKEGGGETEAGGDLTDEEKLALETKEEAAKVEAEAEAEAAKAKSINDDKETLKLKKKEEKTFESETKNQAQAKAQEEATAFFDRVSAPFKADGKEVQIRTPEEAIRLMQMGVNYSRRMKEMKPLREMNAMLEAHGLNSLDKLNELIDLSKGSKEAVQKYLKKHNIDPLDLDMEKADTHSTPNYQSDPKDIAFQDAIDNTIQVEGGKELLSDINKDWDDESKSALRENPSIFGKLLEQKDIGVYSLIQNELLHQKTMGYLADVPFLQAYEQVGNAMEKAGVFNKEAKGKTGLAPIDSGSRKAAPKPKTEQPNPNLSSASKSKLAGSKDAVSTEPDYLSMSDEDFLKLAQPS